MKLSFSYSHSVRDCFTITAVAVLIASYAVNAIASPTLEFNQIATHITNSEPPPPVPENPWGSR